MTPLSDSHVTYIFCSVNQNVTYTLKIKLSMLKYEHFVLFAAWARLDKKLWSLEINDELLPVSWLLVTIWPRTLTVAMASPVFTKVVANSLRRTGVTLVLYLDTVIKKKGICDLYGSAIIDFLVLQ